MTKYLNYEDTENMGSELEVYDVGQGGWEHEDRGFDINIAHTLKEIVRARRKDFFDPAVVRNEVAPDAMQYALRLARWSGFKRELGTTYSAYRNRYRGSCKPYAYSIP